MTSKRRSFISLVFITKWISKCSLIIIGQFDIISFESTESDVCKLNNKFLAVNKKNKKKKTNKQTKNINKKLYRKTR